MFVQHNNLRVVSPSRCWFPLVHPVLRVVLSQQVSSGKSTWSWWFSCSWRSASSALFCTGEGPSRDKWMSDVICPSVNVIWQYVEYLWSKLMLPVLYNGCGRMPQWQFIFTNRVPLPCAQFSVVFLIFNKTTQPPGPTNGTSIKQAPLLPPFSHQITGALWRNGRCPPTGSPTSPCKSRDCVDTAPTTFTNVLLESRPNDNVAHEIMWNRSVHVKITPWTHLFFSVHPLFICYLRYSLYSLWNRVTLLMLIVAFSCCGGIFRRVPLNFIALGLFVSSGGGSQASN